VVLVRVAVLEAERTYSLSRLSYTQKLAFLSGSVLMGTHGCSFSKSMSAACRWLKVPRRLSSPASRTGVPSTTSEPMANNSAVAHSISPCS